MRLRDHLRKDFKLVFLNKTNYFLMILLPLLTTLILGTVFSNNINTEQVFKDEKVGIYIKSDKFKLEEPIMEILKDIGIQSFVANEDELRNKVKENQVVSYIEIDDSNMKLVRGKYNNTINDALELVLSEFKNRSEDMIITQGKAEIKKSVDFVENASVNPNHNPTSFDYFGITQLTMILVNGNMAIFDLIVREKRNGTLKRIASSPTEKSKFFFSKILIFALFLIIQLTVLFTINIKIFNVYYGNIINTVVLCLAFGVFQTMLALAASMIPNGNSYRVLNIVNQVIILLGGGYIPVENLGELAGKLSIISPVRWINIGLLDAIYGGTMTNYWKSFISSTVFSIILFAIGYYFFQKVGVENDN